MGRLTLIGLGISDERGISLEGLDRLKGSDISFAELFTSLLVEGSIGRLEALSGQMIEVLDRTSVEEEDRVLQVLSRHGEVCLLTAGDPLTATTHQELRLRALEGGHRVDIVHSASVYVAAAGAAGLQHYKFGRTTTLPFPEGDYLPTSPLEVILENMSRGLHSLVLLDIQADRDRYMTCSEACSVLLKMKERSETTGLDGSTMVIGVARVGRPDAAVIYGTVSQLMLEDMGDPPHSLIVPGPLHFMEEGMLKRARIGKGP